MADLCELKCGQRECRPWWKGGKCTNRTCIQYARFEGLAIPLYTQSLLWSFYIVCHLVLTLDLCSGRLGEPHRQINMSLFDFRRFHTSFVEHWSHWVQRAPASWKQDGFLTQNSLVGITLRYGQNQPMMVPRSEAVESINWGNDRDYRHIRQLTFSLATHIRYVHVCISCLVMWWSIVTAVMS